jgi:hypothetical protein
VRRPAALCSFELRLLDDHHCGLGRERPDVQRILDGMRVAILNSG